MQDVKIKIKKALPDKSGKALFFAGKNYLLPKLLYQVVLSP
jgi:hypothetical protein